MIRPDTVYFYTFESLDPNAYGHTWGLEAETDGQVDDPDEILRERGLNPERFVLLRIREVGPGEERILFDAWLS
jgi:hypothetical protein